MDTLRKEKVVNPSNNNKKNGIINPWLKNF